MKKAYEIVKESRGAHRRTSMDYVNALFEDHMEFHGDRRFADDAAINAGIGVIDGMPVTYVAIEKGHTPKERAKRNFGAPGPEGYRKALRLMKEAEKFHRPVLCLIDTSGAFCGIEAEERGEGQAIAENLMELMTLRTPVISIVVGEGGSGGALALGVADRVKMLSSAVYSVISPEGCASILWKDAKYADRAAENLHLTAYDALKLGVIEEIIDDTNVENEEVFFKEIKDNLILEFNELKRVPNLCEHRYERFRKFR